MIDLFLYIGSSTSSDTAERMLLRRSLLGEGENFAVFTWSIVKFPSFCYSTELKQVWGSGDFSDTSSVISPLIIEMLFSSFWNNYTKPISPSTGFTVDFLLILHRISFFKLYFISKNASGYWDINFANPLLNWSIYGKIFCLVSSN
jgi:hypothetical protein